MQPYIQKKKESKQQEQLEVQNKQKSYPNRQKQLEMHQQGEKLRKQDGFLIFFK